jgi:hypothetical protein
LVFWDFLRFAFRFSPWPFRFPTIYGQAKSGLRAALRQVSMPRVAHSVTRNGRDSRLPELHWNIGYGGIPVLENWIGGDRGPNGLFGMRFDGTGMNFGVAFRSPESNRASAESGIEKGMPANDATATRPLRSPQERTCKSGQSLSPTGMMNSQACHPLKARNTLAPAF